MRGGGGGGVISDPTNYVADFSVRKLLSKKIVADFHISRKKRNIALSSKFVKSHVENNFGPSPVWSLMIQNRDTQNSCFNTSLESYGSDLSDRPAPTQQIWTCWSSEFFHIVYTEECNILDMKDR